VSEAATQKRTPVKRWIILGLIALGVYAAFFGPSILRPVAPAVVLPAEPIGIRIFGFELTNTILATLLTDLVLLLAALNAWRFTRSGNLVPSGFQNFFEMLVEAFYNMAEGTAGKWAKRFFPITGTIFLLVFTANMIKLLPGFESIGLLHESSHGEGYAPVQILPGVYTIDKGQPVHLEYSEGHEGEESTREAGHSEEDELCQACEIVPFLRGSATDLNFTFALAVITVVAVQVFGVIAMGPGYFEKFLQFRRLVSGGPCGLIDFGVGLLEIILEFAKIISFAFRLFGNIFAGALLLSIIGALTAVVIPPGLYIFEVFFGIIQAYVFSLLALVFLSQAVVSHHGGDHEEGHAEAHA
jgi:F-type H+-transporting ATPase subunit a